MIEDWDKHPLICVKKLYEEREIENYCECNKCKKGKKLDWIIEEKEIYG